MKALKRRQLKRNLLQKNKEAYKCIVVILSDYYSPTARNMY